MMQAVNKAMTATTPSNKRAGLAVKRRLGRRLIGRHITVMKTPQARLWFRSLRDADGQRQRATRTAILDSPGPTIWLKLSKGTSTRTAPLLGTASKRTDPA